jgi:hypothetical protein
LRQPNDFGTPEERRFRGGIATVWAVSYSAIVVRQSLKNLSSRIAQAQISAIAEIFHPTLVALGWD